MAWRFQASKFKNTTPKTPKKEDTIFDLPIGVSSTNNSIQASAKYIAFQIDGEGGKLGVVPVGTTGRKLRTDISVVCAHGDLVDDFDFMPYNDDLLVTCSRDDKVKVWKVTDSDVSLSAEIDVGHGRLLETLRPHSTADNIVAVASTASAYILDIDRQCILSELNDIVDKGQSMDWSPDGQLLAISGDKGRQIGIYDPRQGSSPIHVLQAHDGMGREGRVLFCGNKLLSSGFTNKRVEEIQLIDSSKWGKPIHIQEYVSTTGVLIPHYDPDTKLVFLAGKGTNKLFLAELQDRQPFMSNVFEMTLHDQFIGSCLGSKRNVNVMEGQVDTFYQLTKNSILPIPCIVPRRSYREFHADLFPDTKGGKAACSAADWLAGSNDLPATISLAPAGSSQPSVPTAEVPRAAVRASTAATPSVPAPTPVLKPVDRPTLKIENNRPVVKELDYSTGKENENGEEEQEKISATTPTPRQEPIRMRSFRDAEPAAPRTATRIRPKSCVVGQITSKFRHVETLAGIKANNAVFSNLRNVNTRLPPETNGACASNMFIAVPLAGPAGVIGIYDVDEPCKLPDGVMDGVFNKAQVTDLQWNPFDDGQLAVGTDIGVVNIWNISRQDALRNEMQPAKVLKIGGEKIVCLRWHPLARDLLTVALSDSAIELWDTKNEIRVQRILSHEAPVLAMSWSADGKRLASVGKDLLLNVHQPQLGEDCLIGQKKVLESSRAARILYACEDQLIIVIGLTKSSSRQIQLYDASSFNSVYTQHVDNATQPLIPYYDYDSSVLFLTGKGDRIVNMFEVSFDSPYLLPLTHYMAPTGGQAIAFHNKLRCDVMAVEFQRGWRLTDKSMEQLIFRVPRVKKDVFQSDLFPPALATWKEVMNVEEWMNGDSRGPIFVNLQPAGVNALAVAAVAPMRLAKRSDIPPESADTNGGEPDKKEVEKSWSSVIVKDTRLEQDHMEGVAEEEWNDQ